MAVSLTNKATGQKYTSSSGTRATVSPAADKTEKKQATYTSPSGGVTLTMTEKNVNYVKPPEMKQEAPGALERTGKTVSGAAKSTGASFTNFGGSIVEGLNKVGDWFQRKKENRLNAQDREYIAKYEKDLAAALAAGDTEAAKRAQISINQAEYRIKSRSQLNDYYYDI